MPGRTADSEDSVTQRVIRYGTADDIINDANKQIAAKEPIRDLLDAIMQETGTWEKSEEQKEAIDGLKNLLSSNYGSIKELQSAITNAVNTVEKTFNSDTMKMFADRVKENTDALKELKETGKTISERIVGFGDNVKEISSAFSPLKDMWSDLKKGDLSGAASGIADFAESAGSATDGFFADSKLLGGIGKKLGGAIGKVAGPAAAAAVVVDVAEGVADFADKIGKIEQGEIAKSGSFDAGRYVQKKVGKWFEANVGSMFVAGVDSSDVETIQSALGAAHAGYGSDMYNTGLSWSESAMQEYGLTAEQASKMFTSAVVKGGATVEDLDGKMALLSETVKSGNYTMKEAIDQLDTWSKSLSALGGNSNYQSAIGADMEAALSDLGVDSATYAEVTSVVGKYSNNYAFQSDVTAYQQSGMSYGEALVAASKKWGDMTATGYSGTSYAVLNSATTGGKSVMDMLESGDTEGVMALANSDMRVRQALLSYAGSFSIDGNNGSLEDIVSQLSGAEGGMETVGYSVSGSGSSRTISNGTMKIELGLSSLLAFKSITSTGNQLALDNGE